MKKVALILIIVTIFSKVLGFSREIVLAYFYGTSNVSDAYLISATIPTVIFTFVGVAINTTYIPIYGRILNEYGETIGNRFTNCLINALLLFATVLVVIVLIFTEPIVKVFASGFTGDTLALAIQFTKITIFSVYVTGVLYVFRGYLQVKNNFIVPALLGLPLNIIIILSIILSSKTDIIVLGYGKIFAIVAQFLFIIPFLLKNKYNYRFEIDLKNENLKKILYLAFPVMLGTSVNQINKLVDRTIASQIGEGGISALNYANKLNGFVLGVFVTSLATVLFASISKLAAKNDIKALKKALREAINGVIILVVPITLGTIIFSESIVELLFGRGAFDQKAITMTACALGFYSIGMLAFGLREVLSRAFYALQDTKTPMINASIGMVLNIILNFILSKFLGIGGLALATSLAAIFTTSLMFISLEKNIGYFGMKNITIVFLKTLVVSIIMGGIARYSFNKLLNHLNENLALIISIMIGTITYFVIIYFMKIDDIDVIVRAIKKKFRKRMSQINR